MLVIHREPMFSRIWRGWLSEQPDTDVTIRAVACPRTWAIAIRAREQRESLPTRYSTLGAVSFIYCGADIHDRLSTTWSGCPRNHPL